MIVARLSLVPLFLSTAMAFGGLRAAHPSFRSARRGSSFATLKRGVKMSTDAGEGTTVGFIGLGIMGNGMARCLVKGGRKLLVWNRSPEKCQKLLNDLGPASVEIASSPAEVIRRVDVTYGMLSTPEAAEGVFYAEEGILAGISSGKGYVDCATLTVDCMKGMHANVVAKGGRWLEAPVSGSKVPAETGQLIFMCGGDEELFNTKEVGEELAMMGKASYYLGEPGRGTEMKLIVNMIMGSMMASLAEGMCLADAVDQKTETLIEILGLGAMANPMFNMKGPLMAKKKFTPNFPLKHAQKDMRFALEMGDEVGQPLPLAAVANAEYKRARLTHGDDDFCAVIESLKSKP
ncbi:unnamed protein product [Chrysoparadoxa australica]